MRPGLFILSSPITYTPANSSLSLTTSSPYLLLYGGAQPYSSRLGVMIENDVWLSSNSGSTWDLVSGSSHNTDSALPNSSFSPLQSSCYCKLAGADTVYSLGGNKLSGSVGIGTATSEVWSSSGGLQWTQSAHNSFQPGRVWPSCESTLHSIVVTGGLADGNTLLNDVWTMDTQSGQWKQLTDAAPWTPRMLHVQLVGQAPLLNTQVMYVIGGAVQVVNGGVSVNSNEVWASSDAGATWVVVTNSTQWPVRSGHTGVMTAAGVLLIAGGSNSATSQSVVYNDLWVSFDGGVSWGQCSVDAGNSTNNSSWIRDRQSSVLTVNEQLLLAAGAMFNDIADDVWLSGSSLSDPAYLASICDATIPSAGIGLSTWPGYSTSRSIGGGGGALSAGAILGVVAAVLVGVALTVAGVKWLRGAEQWQTGRRERSQSQDVFMLLER